MVKWSALGPERRRNLVPKIGVLIRSTLNCDDITDLRVIEFLTAQVAGASSPSDRVFWDVVLGGSGKTKADAMRDLLASSKIDMRPPRAEAERLIAELDAMRQLLLASGSPPPIPSRSAPVDAGKPVPDRFSPVGDPVPVPMAVPRGPAEETHPAPVGGAPKGGEGKARPEVVANGKNEAKAMTPPVLLEGGEGEPGAEVKAEPTPPAPSLPSTSLSARSDAETHRESQPEDRDRGLEGSTSAETRAEDTSGQDEEDGRIDVVGSSLSLLAEAEIGQIRFRPMTPLPERPRLPAELRPVPPREWGGVAYRPPNGHTDPEGDDLVEGILSDEEGRGLVERWARRYDADTWRVIRAILNLSETAVKYAAGEG